MRILIVHNDYGRRSGEEAVVEGMHAMLSGMGHEVAELRASTEGVRDTLAGKVRGFVAGLWSPEGVRSMRRMLREFRPDVVNVHNLYPFISPAALFECRKAGVPVMMTVHNFRLICPTGLFMRGGVPCELCLERGDEWGCVRHNCEQSRLKSLGYAARNAVARLTGAYRHCVTRYACITGFQRSRLIAAGFDPARIVVIPNSVDAGHVVATPVPPAGYVAYCGRISREKGVDMVIEVARRHPDIEFRLAGAVRDADLVADLPANVRLTGFLSGEDLDRFYRDSRFAVMASRWYEGFPMSILEAARFGRPVVGPDHGGFTEIISGEAPGQAGERVRGESPCVAAERIGLLFSPGDVESLDKAVTALWNDRGLNARLGTAARRRLDTSYSTGAVARQWQRLLDSMYSCHS